ncbi:hypothetical protein [Brevibacillus centrosporus]|uniref:hypothetical protein n=1 Tax=Brevibacillus centrosporus TaxID=54910 RepID=UPI00398838B0
MGTTTVTCMLTDPCGGFAESTFNVTVRASDPAPTPTVTPNNLRRRSFCPCRRSALPLFGSASDWRIYGRHTAVSVLASCAVRTRGSALPS